MKVRKNLEMFRMTPFMTRDYERILFWMHLNYSIPKHLTSANHEMDAMN